VPLDETKITAKLPTLDVEITRRELPEENAETITLRMTAVPSFAAFAGILMQQDNVPLAPFGAAWMSPWMDLWSSPLLSWTCLAQAAWALWLEPTTPRVASRRNDADDV